jgi:hypothetical protein
VGGVISPLLSNIFLDQLDRFVADELLPAYNQGTERRINPSYNAAKSLARYYRNKGNDQRKATALRKQMQKLPRNDPHDPGYRRLRYVRYADDFLLGFAGPESEAQDIKQRLGAFLRDHLKLELSAEKTLVTHAESHSASFLGYDIGVMWENTKHGSRGQRNVNGRIALKVPPTVIEDKCQPFLKNGYPTHRSGLINEDDFSILVRYQSEYRGVVQYYRLAQNLHSFGKLNWTMRGSLLKTLAGKHKSSMMVMQRKLKATVEGPHGPLACLQVVVKRDGKAPLVARYGGISLTRDPWAEINDQPPSVIRVQERNEIVKRLLADRCEMCGSREDVEVHHIRALKNLRLPGKAEPPPWVRRMAARRRKTLVVCRVCHDVIHGRGTT